MLSKNMLIIDNNNLNEVYTYVKENYPEECCGILIGRVDKDIKTVKYIFKAENLNQERRQDRYHLNPVDLLNAEKFAEENNLQIIGFFHSHPNYPATASQTDLNLAWEFYSYLIVSVFSDGIKDCKSWILYNNNFIEEKVEVS